LAGAAKFAHPAAMKRWYAAGLIASLCLAAAATATAQGGMSRQAVAQQAAALTQLGRALFFDPSLSASGKLACMSCHNPAHGYGPPGDAAVILGGKDMRQPGVRAVPSLEYLQALPQFTEHYYESDEEGDASVDNGPTGGLTWDGRVNRGHDQARLPLLSPFEMANADPAAVVVAARRSREAGALRKAAGSDDTGKLFATILEAFEVYEQSYKDFYPYSSKYDAYLAGKTRLTPAEARGFALFNDPAKGNCAHCHKSTRDLEGQPPQFTDYGFVALGLPRNPAIPANGNPHYYDLGLCGPQRTDLKDHADDCGMFIAPSLRNVALRHVFFHNGVFHSLRDAVAFYATRDTDPARWYPRDANGKVEKFNDLPPQYWDNVNVEPPFDRHLGDPPALSDVEIDDIVAFLGTLTDGYRGGK
jgi:cytochrome c peroxidase